MKCCAFLVFFGVVALTVAQQASSETLFVINQPTPLDGDYLSWNDVVDFLLGAMREEVKRRDKEVLPIPDIVKEFHTKAAKFIKLSGKIVADHGWIKNLTTIERTGDAVVIHNDTFYDVTVELGFGVIELGYDHYQVSSGGIKLSGTIAGSVGANSIQIKIAANIAAGNCSARLIEAKVLQLDDMKLVLSGFGVLNGLVSQLANAELATKKQTIVETIEKNLAEQLIKALVSVHC